MSPSKNFVVFKYSIKLILSINNTIKEFKKYFLLIHLEKSQGKLMFQCIIECTKSMHEKIHEITLFNTGAVAHMCSVKKVSFKILQNSQENACVGV